MSRTDDASFLARWARRKEQARRGHVSGEDAARQVAKAGGKADATSSARVTAPDPACLSAPDAAPVTAPSPAPNAQLASASKPPPAVPAPAEPARLPTLEDVAQLTRSSDYSPFVQPGVSAEVRNAAMKQLFTDPHFNVMDGLDTYIDDYGKPDPIPFAMLRQLNQSKLLGLFDDQDERDGAATRASPDGVGPPAMAESTPPALPEPLPGPSTIRSDDDADLRLQQDDGAERAGPAPGAGA